VLLPLDALKIKRQVNPDAFRGRGAVRIFMEEGTTLYRGWGWTMARNAPGSFAVSLVYVVTRWDLFPPVVLRSCSNDHRIIPFGFLSFCTSYQMRFLLILPHC
jgi:hypothetical protein